MTNAASSTDVLQRSNDRSEESQEYFVLIMLCTGRALDRIASAPHGWSREAWRLIFQPYFTKNHARLVVMMLEVLAFPSGTDDAVNSLETMERKIKEFERYANIEIPEFLKIGIVIRQAEEGPMRTHVITNSHRLATFQGIKTEVTNVKEAQSAVMARSAQWTWMPSRKDPRVFPKVLARNRTQRSCVGIARRKGHRACRQRQWKVERFAKERTTGKISKANKCHKCGKIGHMSKDCRSKETSALEAGDELAETGCIEMASIDLQLSKEDHIICIGIDSCAAVTVFPKSVADDYPMFHTLGKAKSYKPAPGKLLPARKVEIRVSHACEPENCGHAQSCDGGVRNERHGTRCLLPQERQRRMRTTRAVARNWS